MQQELELEALLALIAHADNRLQAIFRQRDTVLQTEVQRPRLARLLAQIAAVEPKVQLHRVGAQGVLRGGLAQELPARGPREAMLRERGRRMSGLGRGAEDLRDRVLAILV